MRTRRPPESRLYVKTTIDLPRVLLKQVKHHAVANDTTLKAMVIAALKKHLNLR
jgi:hypothetical protein